MVHLIVPANYFNIMFVITWSWCDLRSMWVSFIDSMTNFVIFSYSLRVESGAKLKETKTSPKTKGLNYIPQWQIYSLFSAWMWFNVISSALWLCFGVNRCRSEWKNIPVQVLWFFSKKLEVLIVFSNLEFSDWIKPR